MGAPRSHQHAGERRYQCVFPASRIDLQLEISRRTLDTRTDSLRLTEARANGGAGNMLDVRQSEQLVDVAAENIPDFERRVQQQE